MAILPDPIEKSPARLQSKILGGNVDKSDKKMGYTLKNNIQWAGYDEGALSRAIEKGKLCFNFLTMIKRSRNASKYRGSSCYSHSNWIIFPRNTSLF